MATNTSGGTTTSFSNTPQATDDAYTRYEDGIYYFDVMADDLGGNAKMLWSIDDTTLDGATGVSGSSDGTLDLTIRDAVGVCNYSDKGARIWITADGKVGYDASIFNYLGVGQTATDKFTYAIRLSNGTLSWATVTVTISGSNDGPDISVGAGDKASDTLAETNSGLATSGTLTVVDPDKSDNVTVSISNFAKSGNAGSLTDAQLQAMLSLSATTLAADPGSTHNLGWSFASTPTAFDYLAAGESLTLTYTVSADDGHGGTDSQAITITITGTNDQPDIKLVGTDSASAGLNETDAGLTASGTLTVADPDTSDTVDVSVTGVVPSGTGGTGGLTNAQLLAMLSLSGNSSNAADGTPGSLGWSFNSGSQAFDYLATGETLILTYTLAADDHHLGGDTQTVTVTITGTNDQPVITSSAQSGTVVEDSAQTPSLTDSNQASGTISFSDVDLSDGHTATFAQTSGETHLGTFSLTPVSEAANAATGSVGWTYTIDEAAAQYLAAGETVTEHYVVTVDDGHGGTAQQTVTVTITGTNDQPDIKLVAGDSASAGLNETDAGLTASGTLTVADPDTSDTVDVSVTGVVASGTGGTGGLTNGQLLAMLSLSGNTANAADGAPGSLGWSFNSGAQPFDYLATGETLVLTYTLAADDHHLGSDTQTVTVTITGTNDAPTVAAALSSDPDEADSSYTMNLLQGASDVDHGETATLSVSNVSYQVDAGPSSTTAPAGLSLTGGTLTVDPADPAFDHLAAGETMVITVSYNITDVHGASVPQTATITVHGTNDSPYVQTAIADQHVNEDTAWSFTVPAGAFADPDTNDTLTYSATLANGDPLPLWLSFNPVTHSFSGTPPQDFNGTISLKVTVTDDGNLSASDTFDLIVDPVNDAPVNTLPVAFSTNEDTPVKLAGLSVSDVDAASAAISVTLSVGGGTLSAASGGGVTVSGSGSGSITLSGSQADINAYLANVSSQPTFTPVANANGPVSLTMTTSDNGNTGSGGALGDTDVSAINITPVNDAPAGTDGSVTTAEDTAKVLTAGDFGFTDPNDSPANAFASVKITTLPGAGTLTLNSVAVTAGQLVSVADVNAGLLVYTPATDASGSTSLTFQVQDDGGTANGGINLDASPNTLTINVTPVNDAPDIRVESGDAASAILTETNSGLSASHTLTVTDVDTSDTISTSLSLTGISGDQGTLTNAQLLAMFSAEPTSGIAANVGDANNLTWTFNSGTEAFHYLAPGQSLQLTYTLTVSDGHGGTDTQAVTVTINGTADGVTLPATFTGTGDPNDFDSLGNPAGQNLSGTATNGNDTIYGGAGADTINGGAGDDIIYGGSGGDTLGGGNDGDRLYGGSGSDTISGGNSNDVIIGGYGADTLTGSAGNDTFVYLDARDTNDTITDFTSGADKIDLSAIDADPLFAGDQGFTFGGTTATAHGIWYAQSGGNVIVYVDTDGNVSTAELAITLTGVSSVGSGDFLLGP